MSKALREVGKCGGGIPLPIRLVNLGEHRSGVRGKAPENFHFCAIFCVKNTIFMLLFREIYHVFTARSIA